MKRTFRTELLLGSSNTAQPLRDLENFSDSVESWQRVRLLDNLTQNITKFCTASEYVQVDDVVNVLPSTDNIGILAASSHGNYIIYI